MSNGPIDIELGNHTRKELDEIRTKLSSMEIGLPLVWLWVWDVINSTYDSMAEDEGITKANPLYTKDDIWNTLWEGTTSFSLEWGVEQLDEEIRDWIINNDFIIDIEGLDEEDTDVVNSAEEEV